MKIFDREVCFQVVEGVATGGLDAEAGAMLSAEGHNLIGVDGRLVAIDAHVMEPPPPVPALPQHLPTPELLTAEQAAALLGIGRSLFLKMRRKGNVPAPQYLGDLPRWSRVELTQWIAAGLPKQEDWEKSKRKALTYGNP